MSTSEGSFLRGVRILEVANELGEYCGKVLAGLGADVVKVEPAGGEETRSYGPFLDDEPGPDRSLYFWHYNFGKRAIELDLDSPEGQASFRSLAEHADVVLDTRPRGWMDSRGLGSEALAELNPSLVYSRISPFGDTGPWAGYHASDLVHLALGGVMMNCGYDPTPEGFYETPPIAPQMWHAYHIAGEMMAMSVISALIYRHRNGLGQVLSGSVHEAVAKNTETDLPNWVFLRQTNYRLTCRHSGPRTGGGFTSLLSLARTKDGRWLLPYLQTGELKGFPDAFQGTVNMLKRRGMELDLGDQKYQDPVFRTRPEVKKLITAAAGSMIEAYSYEHDLWREGQAEGMPWAPVRRPEENTDDAHWQSRESFLEVEHPELDRTFTYVGAKWYAPGLPWRSGPRPPLLGEHTAEVLAEWASRSPASVAPKDGGTDDVMSVYGKPFALSGVRVVDLTWQLASAGAGRYLAAFGAEVIKVEHESRWDGMRYGIAPVPEGGRAARDAATEEMPSGEFTGPNRSGSFMEINSGKLGISLDLKSPEGKAVLAELIAGADMIVEGFSPGTLDRMGFGYERLKELNPDIIYVQQSGMGQHGSYGRMRSFGPVAAALVGLSDMSGLPEPWAPAGIGYSYLDWFGAYNMATAMLAALYRRVDTGRGCWIDSSQAETGLYLTGTAVLDHSANGRSWSRYGNRSPSKPAAPHGAYRTAGEDRWIAVAAFTEDHWASLVDALGSPSWANEPRFATLEQRLAHQDELDALVSEATESRDGFELMAALQAVGVPAGVCQTAEDRYENDPQLAHLEWMVELDQDEIGRWPVKEHPVDFSRTPAYIGGPFNRSGPSYGQDTEHVLSSMLGYDEERIARLRQASAI